MVCEEDNREMRSTEQLREHLAMGHTRMYLMREESALDEFEIATNLDKMWDFFSELTKGDVEKNLLLWAKDRPQHLRVSVLFTSLTSKFT